MRESPPFPSKLGIIEIYDQDLDTIHPTKLCDIVDLASWLMNINIKQEIVSVVNIEINAANDKNFVSNFEIFCKCVFSLLIEKQMAIDIKVECKSIDKSNKTKCIETFISCFNTKKMIKEYQAPKCNNMSIKRWMTPLFEPIVSFTDKETNGDGIVHIFVVKNVDDAKQW